MDDAPTPPLIFANRVIRQFIDHSFGPNMVVEDKDFLAMRSVFRRCQGEWQKVANGDPVHIALLEKVCIGWGGLPGHKQEDPEDG
jgi:hypothetical protein